MLGWEAGGVRTKIFSEAGLDKKEVPNESLLKSTEDACSDILKQLGRASLSNGSYAFLV